MSEKIISKGIELLETTFAIAQDQAPKLMSEFINYLLFTEAMNLAFKLIVFMIAMNIVRIFGAEIASLEADVVKAEGRLLEAEQSCLRKKENESKQVV